MGSLESNPQGDHEGANHNGGAGPGSQYATGPVDDLKPSLPTVAQTVFRSQQLPPNVSISPITEATVSSFRRIIGLLLPIRYPDKFFAESAANPTSSSLARVAIWHERPPPAKRKQEEKPEPSEGASPTPGTVVGGIQCRIEHLPLHTSSLPPSSMSFDLPSNRRKVCYIQTLALLSPYRSRGIGTTLLESIITTLCTEKSYEGTTSIYAHVWEANDEALEWYVKRGFQVGDLVQGYYFKLKPSGARVVWRDLGIKDYLRQREE